MADASSDDELIARIAKRDMRAFQTLFLRHGGHLIGYAQRYVLARDRAEDITQEVWMKVIRLASSYQGKGHFVAWLYTLTRNLCLNELRSERRLVVTENIGDSEEAMGRENLPPQKTLEEEILNKENWGELKTCIDSLPETQRVALLLYAVEDLSYDDIASELSTSVSAVKSLIFRARSQIAKQVKNSAPSNVIPLVAKRGVT